MHKPGGFCPDKAMPDDMAFVYIVQCADGSYYTGWTKDLDRRIAATTPAQEPDTPAAGALSGSSIPSGFPPGRKPCAGNGRSSS